MLRQNNDVDNNDEKINEENNEDVEDEKEENANLLFYIK